MHQLPEGTNIIAHHLDVVGLPGEPDTLLESQVSQGCRFIMNLGATSVNGRFGGF